LLLPPLDLIGGLLALGAVAFTALLAIACRAVQGRMARGRRRHTKRPEIAPVRSHHPHGLGLS